MAPGTRQKRSQIDAPLPSSAAAPSIWKALVATPQTKSRLKTLERSARSIIARNSSTARVSVHSAPTMNAQLPGQPWPLGATPGPTRTNFALYAPDASRVELCLFDDGGSTERQRLPMPACRDGVWHGEFDGVTAGAVYGYRVHG